MIWSLKRILHRLKRDILSLDDSGYVWTDATLLLITMVELRGYFRKPLADLLKEGLVELPISDEYKERPLFVTAP
jgi:hypothetical protein